MKQSADACGILKKAQIKRKKRKPRFAGITRPSN
jgi:hypothetical protein